MFKSVADCYRGKSVFITGGTGFLGKALVEKLLFSCPGLDKIYFLVRGKQNIPAELRVQKILKQQLFVRLRHERYEVFKKIVPIAGDITKPNLGIKYEDEQLLINNVSMIFHAAATTKFNEPLDVAMNVNVAGTERVINLSKRMKNLKLLVYISTAYSNLDKHIIDEVVYPAPVSINEIGKRLKIGMTQKQVKKLLDKRPNTYTFTKALAETLVAENHKNVPSIIIRPSITSSLAEPTVGWIDNWYGATGLMNYIGRGLNRVLLASPTNIVDFIPVDYVTNLIIVAASKCESSKNVAIFNICTSGENPIVMEYFLKLVIEDHIKHKAYDLLMPSVIYTQSRTLVSLVTILQTIPAFLTDMFLLANKKQMRYMKTQDLVLSIRDPLDYFTSNSWVIRAPNTRALAQSLSASEKEQFPCDPKDIKWEDYVPIFCQGVRHFLY